MIYEESKAVKQRKKHCQETKKLLRPLPIKQQRDIIVTIDQWQEGSKL